MRPLLVLGLGNPYLGDDGIGWKVVEKLQKILAGTHSEVEFDCLSLGGLRLMERLEGYQKVILVDAILEPGSAPGTIRHYSIDDLPTGHADDIHSSSLKAALHLGEQLGMHLPDQIYIIGMVIEPSLEFQERLSHPVEASLVLAMKEVMRYLQ